MKHLPTGNNKDQFEKWLSKWIFDNIAWVGEIVTKGDVDMFYKYPFEMQQGILTSYYDSLDVEILIDRHKYLDGIWCYYFEFKNRDYQGNYSSREEAYKEASIKANELINENE